MTIAVIAAVIALAPGTAGLLVIGSAGFAYRLDRDVGRRDD
jgi:hypothetical protein